MKLGATDVDLEFPSVTVPREVLRSETLVRLSLMGCGVYGNYVISCSMLKSLSLVSVNYFGSDDVFKNIISLCIRWRN